MKRKAILTTLKESGIILVDYIVGIVIGGITFYLLIMIPIWFMRVFGLMDRFEDIPAVLIYAAELLIYLVVFIIIKEIYQTYEENLENEKMKEADKYREEHGN